MSEADRQGSPSQVGCAKNVKPEEKEGEWEEFLSSTSFPCWYWTHICGQRGQCSVTSECETHHTTVLWKHDPVAVNRDALGWLLLGVNIVVSANKDGLIPQALPQAISKAHYSLWQTNHSFTGTCCIALLPAHGYYDNRKSASLPEVNFPECGNVQSKRKPLLPWMQTRFPGVVSLRNHQVVR